MRRVLSTLALLAFVALPACSGGGGQPGDAVADTQQVAETPPACADLVGMPTDEVVALDNSTGCMGDTGPTYYGFMFYDCPDGRQLRWNDYGWGYTGGTWQAHARPDGQLVPPDADTAACPG